ncbi:uncharacterized protein FFMR_07313 [Fusarium fujikuroi]|nr:uncharacterized protein FFMR_07313 [Fusarium fujikuroi]
MCAEVLGANECTLRPLEQYRKLCKPSNW